MAYFNYHAKIKNLIKNRHCIAAKLLENYHNISPALVLFFDNHTAMPIRIHRFPEYFELLNKNGISIENKCK